MKKLKSNRGITLPFTVVIMFFVALLMAALVGYVSLSYQISTRQIRLAEHKIILENVMYKYITGYYSDDEFNGYDLKIDISDEKKLIIELKDTSNYINIVLKAELQYSDSGTGIEITKWGFK